MNDIFNSGRFFRYMKYDLLGGMKPYLLVLAFLCGVLFIPVLFNYIIFDEVSCYYDSYKDPYLSTAKLWFIGGLFITATLSASLMFSNLRTKEGRVSALTIPASSLEKFIVRWLINIPLSIAVFIFAFEFIELLRFLIVTAKAGSSQVYFFTPADAFEYTDTAYVFAILAVFQSVFALGSILWPKWSAAKTVLSLFLIFMTVTFYGIWLSEMFVNEHSEGMKETSHWVILTVMYGFSFLLYVLSYFRFKEIEIIQRW